MHWKSILNHGPTDWLLETDNPSVRYFTLTDLLNTPASDTDVLQAKENIMKTGIVPIILSKQEDDHWESAQNFYIKTKYKGTMWTLLILAELNADGTDERIKKACTYILDHAQHESGAFAYASSSEGGGDHDKVLPCLTGNMMWALLRLGITDPRISRGIDWITTYQRFDDKAESPKGWPYHHKNCWGRHTCHMGVVKALKALAEIPENRRTDSVRMTIENGAEYLLNHHIYKQSHNLSHVSKREWLHFGFPLMWNTDVLEIITILTKLGYKDERMQEAVDLVLSKQNPDGTWNLETTYNGRYQVRIERKGTPSKWITLFALRVLKRYMG